MEKLVVLLAVGALLPACQSVPVNNTDNPTANWVVVSDGLYRGARPDETAVKRLATMGVKTILNLEDDPNAVAAERVWTDADGITQVSKPMTGTQSPDDTTVSDALSLLDDPASRPIFVHCLKGQARTGAVIALHRVFNEGWSATDARNEMMALGYNSALIAMADYVDLKIGL